MASYAVFGGAGFIGTNLCQRLRADGHRVTIFGRSGPPQTGASEDFQAYDLAATRPAPNLDGFEVVIHLISTMLPALSNTDPIRDVQENVAGTLQLMDAAVKAKVRRFIFISSGGTVYGAQQTLPIEETAVSEPQCSYAIAKRTIESYLHLYRRLHGLDSIVLRLANPFGPFQFPGGQGLVANAIDAALNGNAMSIWGDGKIVRDYIYIDDVVDAIATAAALDAQPTDLIFNIGSGVGRSIIDILDAVEQAAEKPIRRSFTQARQVDVPANVLDIRRARELLHWQPETTWRDGLQTTVAWQVAHVHRP